MHRERASHGLPPSSGCHHFGALMFFKMEMSSIVSASSFFSFAFWSSGAFRRL